MRLFLVRHGQTPANVIQSIDTTIPGPGLTEAGMRQANALPTEFDGVPIDAMWVSTMVRTSLTAAPLATDRMLAPAVMDGLREVGAGALERRNDDDAHTQYRDVVSAWLRGNLDAAMPEGRNGHDFLGRYDAAVDAIVATGHETAVVVSHGTAIRYWSGLRVAGLDPEFIDTNFLPNTGVVEIEGTTGDWRLVSWLGRSGAWAGDPDESVDASGAVAP